MANKRLYELISSSVLEGTDSLVYDNSELVESKRITYSDILAQIKSTFVKSDVGLGNVDNTSDADKPLSTLSAQLFSTLTGNGVVSGCLVSINTDTTKIDIASGVVHFDNTLNKTFTGATGIAITGITTSNITYIALDSDLNVIQSTTPFTPSQRRTYAILGAAIHSNRTAVNAINNLPDVAIASAAQLDDLMEGIKNFNFSGNEFSANGDNLYINKTAGYLFKKGSNFHTDNNNPHIKEMPELIAPSTIRYRLSDGTEYSETQEVSLYYESTPGVRTTLGMNKYSIQRIVLFSSNLIRIQYGAASYNKLSDALAAIQSEDFTMEENMRDNGLLRCMLIVKGGMTSCQDDAIFIHTNRFGDIPPGTSISFNLQTSYENSGTTEIITDDVNGALTVQRGSAADTDNVIEVKNGAGTTTFQVDGNGKVDIPTGQTYDINGTPHAHTGVYEPANANIQSHISSTSNPHGVDAEDVGLNNVQNINWCDYVSVSTNSITITDETLQDGTYKYKGKTIWTTSASPVSVAVASDLGMDFVCGVIQGGAGQVTFSGLGDVTIENENDHTKTSKLRSAVSLRILPDGTCKLIGETA